MAKKSGVSINDNSQPAGKEIGMTNTSFQWRILLKQVFSTDAFFKKN